MKVLRERENIIELANNDLVIEYDADTIQEAKKDDLLIFFRCYRVAGY